MYIPFEYDYNEYISAAESASAIAQEWCGGIPDINIGFQWTFYTTCINDLFLNIDIPIGIYPWAYFRNNENMNLSNGYYIVSIGYASTWIWDPILLYLGVNTDYKFEFNNNIYYQYLKIGFKIGYTEVINQILCYSVTGRVSIKTPLFKNFEGQSDPLELWLVTFFIKVSAIIRLSDSFSYCLSVETPINTGSLNPTIDMYFYFKY